MSTSLFSDPTEVHRSAIISDDGLYRYRLDRWWGDESTGTGSTRLPFMMLNPSTADADLDDPTIRRCIGFARREGFSGITVVNIGAFRATDPEVWARSENPFGIENTSHILNVVGTTGHVVAAWGSHPAAKVASAIWLRRWAEDGTAVTCLGSTKSGAPRHPLYVRGDQPLVTYAAGDRS